MFKIAFIGQKGIPVTQGGVERHVEELAIRLAHNGHEVFVYTRPRFVPKEYTKYEKVNLVSLPSLRTKNLDAITHTFISILHAIKNRVDIIHFQGVGPSLLSWLPRIINPRIKVVSTVHSADWEHQKWSSFAKHMLKLGANFACNFAHETLAVSRSLQKYCLARHQTDVVYIPNGVANLGAKHNENSKNILKSFNLQPQKYILVVTRLVKHKGVHYLIEAFKNLKNSSQFADYKLVIVGSTAFTENYQTYLKNLSQSRSDIIFTGAQTGANLDSLFRHAYLYCSPSESEGLSISILEAMAYAKPILVSDIEENLELISGNSQTGAVGFDFKNKDVIDLQQRLETLLTNQDVARHVGKKAQNYVKLYYNWEEITARTERLYKNTVHVKDKCRSLVLKPALSRFIPFL